MKTDNRLINEILQYLHVYYNTITLACTSLFYSIIIT